MPEQPKYETFELVGYRVPDYSVEPQGDGTNMRVELPGIFRLGVLFGDQFVEVTSFKAGLLQNSAAQAAQRRESDRQQAAKAEQQLREQEAAEQEKASASESTAAPGE
jgi:hypothetical protein